METMTKTCVNFDPYPHDMAKSLRWCAGLLAPTAELPVQVLDALGGSHHCPRHQRLGRWGMPQTHGPLGLQGDDT